MGCKLSPTNRRMPPKLPEPYKKSFTSKCTLLIRRNLPDSQRLYISFSTTSHLIKVIDFLKLSCISQSYISVGLLLFIIRRCRAEEQEPVVIHKSKPKAHDLRDPKTVNQAIRTGGQVQTIKKFDAGLNKKPAAAVVNTKKLDEAAEPAALERVPTEVRHRIQKARIDKKMGQAELAKQINEKPQVVQEYENGKAVPNQMVLAKMERVLGVKLRGKSH